MKLSQRAALCCVGIGLALLGLFLAWLAWRGLASGETWWPARQASARRMVSRLADPLLFWTAILLYGGGALGALLLLGWGVRVSRVRR